MDGAEPGALPYLRSAAYREVIRVRRAQVRRINEMQDPKKPNNLRTALILVSIALVFFIGLFIKRIWFA